MSEPGSALGGLRDDGPARLGTVPSGLPEPPPPAARIRRRRLAALVALIAMAVVGGGAWALLGSGLFAVRSVLVTGTSLVPQSEVAAVAGVQPGTPLIQVNTAQVAARVLTIRQIVAVQVSTSWPDRVVIAVQERIPALAVALPGGGFDLIDGHGVIVRSTRTRPASVPLFAAASAPAASALATSPSALTGDPDVGAAATVLAELPASVRPAVTSVTAAAPDQVIVELRSGVTIVWGGTDDAAAKAKELTALMTTQARNYDVSSPGTAVTSTTPAG